jgi:hypothetical protein
MGFWDFLKGIIPEKLINVNVDNKKIVAKKRDNLAILNFSNSTA